MNPDKKKVGCLVPLCQASWCNRSRKEVCALRYYFLLNQKQQRQLLSHVFTIEHKIIIKNKIYFWRRNDKKATQE